MCFLDEEGAFNILSLIIESIYPKNFFCWNSINSKMIGYKREKFILKKLIYDALEEKIPNKSIRN